MGISDHLTCLLRNLYAGQEKQQLELDMEQRTGFKLGKEYVNSVYCHPAYLNYMQSTSWEMPGWMKHKLESQLPGNINNFRYADDTTLMAEREEELKSLLMKVKQESEKAGLEVNIHCFLAFWLRSSVELNIKKTKIMASSPINSWQTDGETMETVTDFIFLDSKITENGDCNH